MGSSINFKAQPELFLCFCRKKVLDTNTIFNLSFLCCHEAAVKVAVVYLVCLHSFLEILLSCDSFKHPIFL